MPIRMISMTKMAKKPTKVRINQVWKTKEPNLSVYECSVSKMEALPSFSPTRLMDVATIKPLITGHERQVDSAVMLSDSNWEFIGLVASSSVIIRFGDIWESEGMQKTVEYEESVAQDSDSILFGCTAYSANSFLSGARFVSTPNQYVQPVSDDCFCPNQTCPNATQMKCSKSAGKCWWCECSL